MRFMGDHALARGQTEIDCLLYLLKVDFIEQKKSRFNTFFVRFLESS